MQVIPTPAQWRQMRLQLLQSQKSIGLVPTMGALHQGHLDLVHESLEKCDFTIVSIFVNPTQFNNSADFQKYPQSLAEDLDLLKAAGVDAVFVPTVETMYPSPTKLQLNFGSLEQVLEGAFRPGHFNGVGIVVAKLFHMIQPDYAFFGQKDLQQVAVIRRLVEDMSFPLSLQIVPTRREVDGLAMSSRNRRLNPTQRKSALILYQSLQEAKALLLQRYAWEKVKEGAELIFQKNEEVELEYFSLVESDTFEILEDYLPEKKTSICVAAYLEDIRLIDNIPINS